MDMEFHNWINSYYKSCQEMEADSLEEPWITLFLYGILIQGPRPEPLELSALMGIFSIYAFLWQPLCTNDH